MTLSSARRLTTIKLGKAELPDCFQIATINAAINAQDRKSKSAKASRRRLVAKAYRVSGVA